VRCDEFDVYITLASSDLAVQSAVVKIGCPRFAFLSRLGMPFRQPFEFRLKLPRFAGDMMRDGGAVGHLACRFAVSKVALVCERHSVEGAVGAGEAMEAEIAVAGAPVEAEGCWGILGNLPVESQQRAF
jgi:hypothetical protein